MEEQLTKILQEEFSYDPRPKSRNSSEEEETLAQGSTTKPTMNGVQSPKSNENVEEPKEAHNNEPVVKENGVEIELVKEEGDKPSSLPMTEINQEQNTEKVEEKTKEGGNSQTLENETTSSQTSSNETPKSKGNRNEIKMDEL